MENVITLGKLIGLLILFCYPLHSILFLKTPKIRGMTFARPVKNHFSSVYSWCYGSSQSPPPEPIYAYNLIGERSESLSRVFNDQPRDIWRLNPVQTELTRP